jgi:hypothetical protein
MSGRAKRRDAKRKRHGGNRVSEMRIDRVAGPKPIDLDEYWRELGAYLDSVPERIAELKERLVVAMAPYDAFDVISNVLFANLPLNPETYRESTHGGLAAYAECAALVLLERSDRRGTAERGPIGKNEIESWMPLLREIVGLSSFAESRRVTPDLPAQDPLSDIRRRIVTRELFLRNPIYDWQEEATLRALFSVDRVRADIFGVAGFDLDDALVIVQAFTEIGFDRLRDRREQALAYQRELTEAVERCRAGDAPVDGEEDEVTTALVALPAREAATQIETMAIAWIFYATGDTFQVTPEQLAEQTGVDVGRVGSCLELFSVEFGQPAFGSAFTGQHVLRQRPVIRDGDRNHLCTYTGNLLFALRHQIEDALKRDSAAWERYNRVRKQYVEDSAVAYLRAALKTPKAWTNLTYTIDGEGPFELDGLVTLDAVAVLVEAKAAALTGPARRGAPLRLKRDIETVLEAASSQAERLRLAFEEGREIALADSEGNTVALSRRDIARVFSVVVTLDDFSGVGPTVWDLAEAGLLDLPDALPWIVSLHELEVIAELTKYPALLTLYLRVRREVNERKLVRTADELDLFIHYLQYGLFFDELIEAEERPPDAIFIQSMTDELDAYFMWKRGIRSTPAEPPRQKMHKRFRELLDALESARPDGYIEIEMALLSMPDPDRKMVANRFAEMRRLSARDEKLHDFTLTYSSRVSRGVTLMTGPDSAVRQLGERLPTYCALKKYQLGVDEWLGLAGTPREPVVATIVVLQPWTPDEELEALVAELPHQPQLEQLSVARREWLGKHRSGGT